MENQKSKREEQKRRAKEKSKREEQKEIPTG